MRIHLHLEDDSSPLCSYLGESVPARNDEIVVEVTTGEPPNEVITPTTYKIEKVVYHLLEVLGKDVPEAHDVTMYQPYVDLLVSVVV